MIGLGRIHHDPSTFNTPPIPMSSSLLNHDLSVRLVRCVDVLAFREKRKTDGMEYYLLLCVPSKEKIRI